MSEIPANKVDFKISNSIYEWDIQRSIALFERNVLPKLEIEVKNLSEALASYKKDDYESYKRLNGIITTINNLH